MTPEQKRQSLYAKTALLAAYYRFGYSNTSPEVVELRYEITRLKEEPK